MSIGTDDGAVTRDVRSWNDADSCPAGIVIDDTVGDATVLFLLDSETTTGVGGAHSRVTMPVTAAPPRTGFGVSAIDRARTGRTVSVTDRLAPPYVAVTGPDCGAVTQFVGIANV